MLPCTSEVYPLNLNQNINENLYKIPCHPISEDPLPNMSKTPPFPRIGWDFLGVIQKKNMVWLHGILCYVMSCHVVLYHAMSCNLMVWYGVVCLYAFMATSHNPDTTESGVSPSGHSLQGLEFQQQSSIKVGGPLQPCFWDD